MEGDGLRFGPTLWVTVKGLSSVKQRSDLLFVRSGSARNWCVLWPSFAESIQQKSLVLLRIFLRHAALKLVLRLVSSKVRLNPYKSLSSPEWLA